jgi:hypothetical protein
MLLHNSWLLHFHAVNKSDSANKNFGVFVNAMEDNKSKNCKTISLTEDPNSINTLANNCGRVKFIHSCKKFGGTHNNTVLTVGGLIGHGPQDFPVEINADIATSSKQIKISSTEKIWHCKNVEELGSISTSESSSKGGEPINQQENSKMKHPHIQCTVSIPQEEEDVWT